MKSFIAQAIIWLAYILGLTLGLSFCLAVGYVLGATINHAPITGLLCGFAWWTAGYYQTSSQGLERVSARIEAIKALV